MSTEKTMRIYSSTWGQEKYETFKLFPINKEANLIECIYDGESKVLAIMGNFIKDAFTMMQKIDKDGNGVYTQDFKKVIAKLGNENKALAWAKESGVYPYVKERVSIKGVNEYYLTKPSEIEEFILRVAENADRFDYKKYLDAPAIVKAEPAKESTILSPDQIAAESGKKLSVVQE